MATLTRKIAHNMLYQLISKIIATGIGIAVLVLLTSYLGPKGYGQYTTVIAFLQFFAIIVDLGLYIVLTTKIAEDGVNEERLVGNVFTIRFLSAIIFLGGAPFVALLFPYDTIVLWGIALTSLSFLFITLNQVLWGVFQKHLQMIKISISEVLGRLALLIGTIIVIRLGGNLLWILGMIVMGSLTNFAFTFFFVRRIVRVRLCFDFDVWKEIFAMSWPIAISVFFTLIYFKADTLILQFYHGDEAVGLYGAPYKILEVMVAFPAMFAGLVLPLLANAFAQNNTERFHDILQKALDFLVMTSLPIIVGTWFVAEPLMVLISGEAFRVSGSILRILIIATGIIFVGNLFGNTVVAINRQKYMLFAYFAIAVISLTGYFYFIPRYGYYGAAWMTVTAEGLIALSAGTMVYTAINARPAMTVILKTILASAFMGCVLWAIPPMHVLLDISIGIGAYIAAILALRAVSRETLSEILSPKTS